MTGAVARVDPLICAGLAGCRNLFLVLECHLLSCGRLIIVFHNENLHIVIFKASQFLRIPFDESSYRQSGLRGRWVCRRRAPQRSAYIVADIRSPRIRRARETA